MPPFRFDQAPVPASLADLADTVWSARGTIGYGRERILPTATAILIVNLGSPFRVRASASAEAETEMSRGWLVGPQTGYIENAPVAETDVVGVTLKPWGPGALFDLAGSEVRDRILPIEAIWGPGLETLRDELAVQPGPRERQALLVRALLRRRREPPPGIVVHAAGTLSTDLVRSVGSLSRELRVSRKHLDHLFGRYVGLPPKAFARVHRFDRALQALGAPSPPSLATVAHDHGYYDQAHMNRDFAAFGSVTPTEYLRLRAQHMTEDGDASGLFVPGI